MVEHETYATPAAASSLSIQESKASKRCYESRKRREKYANETAKVHDKLRNPANNRRSKNKRLRRGMKNASKTQEICKLKKKRPLS